MKTQRTLGFTLLEILLVVAIIAILASIVILAINPNKQLGDSRNTQRRSDLNTILSAVYQYSIDNGKIPDSISTADTEICRTDASSCSGYIDLGVLTASEKYLVSIPKDPSNSVSNTNGTGYRIQKDSYNRIIVSAPYAENSITISATR